MVGSAAVWVLTPESEREDVCFLLCSAKGHPDLCLLLSLSLWVAPRQHCGLQGGPMYSIRG